MNLDELQIKISIELDDLNKQLKTVTKGIDKALGPKATRKLMADNNKIVKSGLTSINKTTLNLVKKSRKDTTKEIEAMSKDITKTLNKAFDVSFTKLNSNITSAMNQAKMTVRSACNDIRRELNAALNIKGNIRVISKTSITGSATGSSGSNAASSISSGQYIGAMIIKATNAVIANNNANTTRLEHAIDNLGNKLTSAIKGINININNDDVVKAINNLGKKGGYRVKPRKPQQQEQEENLPAVIPQETKAKPKKKIQIGTKSNGIHTKYSKVDSGIFFTLEQLNHKVNFILGEVTDTGAFLKALQEALKQSVKATNRYNRFMDDIRKSINIKRLGTGSYGNEIVKSYNKPGASINRNTSANRNKEYFTGEVVNPGIIPTQVSKQLQNIIEDVSYRVLDLETGLMNTSNFDLFGLGKLDTSQVEAMKKAFKDMQNIRKQSRMPRLNEPTEDYDASESMAKELHRQVASLMDMAQELNEAFHKTPMGIDEAVQQANFLEGALDAVLDASKDLTSLSPQIAKGFEFARDVLNQMAPGIRALANEIRSFTKPQAPAGIPDLEWQEISPSKRPQTPASIIGDIEWRDIDDIDSSKLNDIKAKLKEVNDVIEVTLSELAHVDSVWLELNSIKDFVPIMDKLIETLNKLDAERIKLKIDTSDAQKQIETVRDICEMLKAELSTGNINAVRSLFPDAQQPQTQSQNKFPGKPANGFGNSGGNGTSSGKSGKPPKPTIMGFGFGAYKNEIDTLVEYAKKAGDKIKKALFGKSSDGFDELAFTIEDNGPNKDRYRKPLGIKDETIDTMDKAFKALDKTIKTFDAIVKDFDKSVKEFKSCINKLSGKAPEAIKQSEEAVQPIEVAKHPEKPIEVVKQPEQPKEIAKPVESSKPKEIVDEKQAQILDKRLAIVDKALAEVDELINGKIIPECNKTIESFRKVSVSGESLSNAMNKAGLESRDTRLLTTGMQTQNQLAKLQDLRLKASSAGIDTSDIEAAERELLNLLSLIDDLKMKKAEIRNSGNRKPITASKLNELSDRTKEDNYSEDYTIRSAYDEKKALGKLKEFASTTNNIVNEANKVFNTVLKILNDISLSADAIEEPKMLTAFKNNFANTFNAIKNGTENVGNIKPIDVFKEGDTFSPGDMLLESNEALDTTTDALQFALEQLQKLKHEAVALDIDTDELEKAEKMLHNIRGLVLELNAITDATMDKKTREFISDLNLKDLQQRKNAAKHTVNDIELPERAKDIEGARYDKVGRSYNLLPYRTEDIEEHVAQLDAMIKKPQNEIAEHIKSITADLIERGEGIEEIDAVFKEIQRMFKEGKEAFGTFDKGSLDYLRRTIQDIMDLRNDLEEAMNKASKQGTTISDVERDTFTRRARHAGEVDYGEADNMSLGFSAYRKELEQLSKLAKKVGAGIKKALKGAFNINVGPKKLDRALTVLEYSASSVANKIKTKMGSVGTYLKAIGKVMTEPMRKSIRKMGQEFNYVPRLAKLGMNRTSALVKSYSSVIRTHLNKAFTGIKTSKIYTNVSKALNKVKGALNKVKSTVSKFSDKVRATLNKAFTGIKTSKVYITISKVLSKAKGVLNKFANSCKTIWGKIKQIFSKGANDASRATGKLTSGLKGLLAQAFGFFSIYSLINLGREAITQSQTLAQAEIKLTSLMKQRMGATNDTVTAIRQLVEEQSKLGVVSKTALTRGAEQLSMYVHSAKALKDLMPAIANLTAKRGGFMATEDDAEEIATQLGEAIREGTTTPLEQSGIYLSEAEIKKFAALRTEEERAAYLANVIAKNVGNINQALANTPIGAMTQLKNNFKELLGTLGIFLANVLKPIVQWLNVIVVACNNALKALGKLLGFDMTGGALSVGDIGAGGSTEVDTGGIDDAKDSLDDTADSAKDAEKAVEKFKGSLMGFDEINVLSDNTGSDSDPSEEFDPTDITPGEGGQLIPDVGELTEGEGPFDKFADKMKAFMDEVLEPFKNAWALLGDRWKAEWADLIDSFKHFCDSLATFLKSVWEHGGKEFVQHLAEIGLACGIAAMEIGGEILDSLARLWEHLDPSKNMNTQGFLDALNEVSVKIRDFILGLGDHFESLMANGGQDVLNAFGDMFMNLGEAATRGLGVAIDALDGLIDHLDPANNKITRGMLKAWEDAFHSIGQMALDFVDLLESIMANGGQEVVNAMGDTFNSLLGLIGTLVDEGAKALSGLFKHLDPSTNEYTKGMLKAWKEAFESITDMFGEFGELISSTMENGGQEIVNSIGDLGANIVGAIGEIVDEVAKAFAELFDHMDPAKNKNSKDMLKSFDKLVDSLSNFVDAIAKAFKKFMDSGGREFVKNLGDILAIVADLAFTLGGGIIDLITGFINSFVGQKLIEGVAKALEWFSDKLLGLKDAVQIIKDAFQDVIDIIVGIFEGDGEKVGRAFASLIKNALKLTGELVEWLVQLGMDLVAGLVKGICSLPKLLWEAVKFLFDTIVGFFKELFGIHSPSTVFADLGVNLIEGLIEGIKGMLGAVGDVLSEIGEAIFGWFEDILSSASENWNKLCDETSKKWGELKENVSDKCKDIYEDTKEKWTDIKDKTIEIASDLKDKAVEKYTQLKDKLTDTTDKWRQNSEEKWSKVKEKTSEIVSNLKSTVEEKYTKFKDALTDTMEKWRSNNEDRWNKVKNKTSELVSNLKSDTETKYNTMKENLTSKLETWRSTSESKWNNIKSKTTELVGNLKSDVEQKYETLKSNLGSKMENLKSDMQTKWENIKSKTTEIVNNLKSEVEKKYGELKTNLGTKLEEVKSEASSKWESIKTTTSTKVREVVDEATKKYGEMKSSFTKKMDEVKTALGPKWTELKNSVKTNASGIASKVSEGLSNVKQKFTKPFEDAKKAVGEVINSIGRTFKNANWSFPKIKLPHIKVTGEWSFNPPRVPSFGIEWRKRGGIIDGITPIGFANGALQMGGEAGKEMVVPLENTSFTSKIAQAMGQAVDNAMARNMNGYYGSSYNVIDDNRDIVLKINDREFARASINSINKLQRESGRTLLDI